MDESPLQMFIDSAGWIGGWLIGPILLLVLFGYFHLRAGTSYGFLSRLYALLIGRSEFHNESLTAFWQERKDVERFNALFNTKAKSLKDIELFVRWIENYDLDIRKFTRLKSWFDFEKRQVKKLKVRQLVTPLVFTLISYLASITATDLASTNAALIKLGGEEQWIWVGHSEASSFSINPFSANSDAWRLTKTACGKAGFDASLVASEIGLQGKSINAICESFSNSEDAKRIDSFIAKQKIFWLLAVILWVLALNFFSEALRRAGAHKARPYLRDKFNAARLRRATLAPSGGGKGAARVPLKVASNLLVASNTVSDEHDKANIDS